MPQKREKVRRSIIHIEPEPELNCYFLSEIKEYRTCFAAKKIFFDNLVDLLCSYNLFFSQNWLEKVKMSTFIYWPNQCLVEEPICWKRVASTVCICFRSIWCYILGCPEKRQVIGWAGTWPDAAYNIWKYKKDIQ